MSLRNAVADFRSWAESVPAGFRFSLKMPKDITHRLTLKNAEIALDDRIAFHRDDAGVGQHDVARRFVGLQLPSTVVRA